VTWLVTGGAGYIGAHVVAALTEASEDVVVLDELSSGDATRIAGVPLVVGSVLDGAVVGRTLAEHRISGVVHLAAKKQVEESVRLPLLYYRENVEGLRVLLEAVTDAGVGSFVFSSSAAVYGAPEACIVREDADCRPVNPYGRTKLIGEQMISDVAAATGLRHVSLRYFNVAGSARPELADRGAANLVPMVFRKLTAGVAPQIFGGDFPTPDGTCVRDFVHVRDIASAHVAAARALREGGLTALTANIGRGEGISVRETIDVIREVTGTADQAWSEPTVLPRRAGDPPSVVAAADRIRDTLGWRAQHGLRDMVESAWAGWTAAHRTEQFAVQA
jgi:UDP-glucose 4-epimerase